MKAILHTEARLIADLPNLRATENSFDHSL